MKSHLSTSAPTSQLMDAPSGSMGNVHVSEHACQPKPYHSQSLASMQRLKRFLGSVLNSPVITTSLLRTCCLQHECQLQCSPVPPAAKAATGKSPSLLLVTLHKYVSYFPNICLHSYWILLPSHRHCHQAHPQLDIPSLTHLLHVHLQQRLESHERNIRKPNKQVCPGFIQNKWKPES